MPIESNGGILQDVPYLAQVVVELKDEVKELRNATRELERAIDRMDPERMKQDAASMEKRLEKLEAYRISLTSSLSTLRVVMAALWAIAMAVAGVAISRTH